MDVKCVLLYSVVLSGHLKCISVVVLDVGDGVHVDTVRKHARSEFEAPKLPFQKRNSPTVSTYKSPTDTNIFTLVFIQVLRT